ncbi:unnamed protein product [Allacma fusca]|uniref:DNA polymerase alpha catalytic subunit N-terminal domain-containing protein n=1 Tax=Allacma fusca TaxID=39272 RepID=A0A8J2KGH9_9HEXA|nr:unnamed protein product [Allacma fusca]
MEDDPNSSRSRPSRADISGRNAAVERLKNLRGQKNKYEVTEMQNVYDIVDEREYSKKINDRQRDDWIIDDNGKI